MKLDRDDIVLVAGVRTPFGAFGGSLKDLSANDLGVVAARAALDRSGFAPGEIDHVIFGNALQTSGRRDLLRPPHRPEGRPSRRDTRP